MTEEILSDYHLKIALSKLFIFTAIKITAFV